MVFAEEEWVQVGLISTFKGSRPCLPGRGVQPQGLIKSAKAMESSVGGLLLHQRGAPLRGADSELVLSSPYFQSDINVLRLKQDFFNQPCVSLAKAFLGKVLVRRNADGAELKGRVVETEAYLGGEDAASHSAGGKRTERNVAMFMRPGTIYVYPIYGIYLCMNVSSQGEGAAVLLRALEPLQGHGVMHQHRAARRRVGARALKDRELCNGPSKLCQALAIPRAFDRGDLATHREVWLERDPEGGDPEGGDVVAAPRIGIESHGEWARKPLRFYLRGHPCVSVVNRDAERHTHTHLSGQGDRTQEPQKAQPDSEG